MTKRVLIVGAGPSGTACAITLHRLGHDVTVVDKATFPRDKCCGDGLTTNALRILEGLGFRPDTVADWKVSHNITVRSPDGLCVDMQLPQGQGMFAAIAPRAQLDHALVEHCRQQGIRVLEGHGFNSIVHHDPDRIIVDIDGLDQFDVDYVVAADGMWSPIRKSLGLISAGYLGELHAFRQYLSDVEGPAKENLYVWFDKDLLPGYAWSFPLPDNRVNFGFCMLRSQSSNMQFMKKIWGDLFDRTHIREALGDNFVPDGRHSAWPIPARIDSTVHSSGRILFVGDAVCATDIMTGEGIGQALETAIAAGKAIAHGASAQDVRNMYSHSLNKTLLADHRMSRLLSFMLSSPSIARRVLGVVNSSEWSRRNFVRWMFEDEPRAGVFTPKRWHRNFLKRPGAFREIS